MPNQQVEKIQKLLESGQLSREDEVALIRRLDPPALGLAAKALVGQRHDLRRELTRSEARAAKMEAAMAGLQTPPWFLGTVLRSTGDGRADVVSAGRRQIVGLGPGVEGAALSPGDEVFLSGEGVVVGRADSVERTGLVGTVSEVVPGGALVRGPADEEIRALCAPELRDELSPGDRIVYSREFPYVYERLENSEGGRWLLESPRRVLFEEIGGLDDLITEVRSDLDLHMLHPEKAADYKLALMRGLLLIGPPGVGKTLLAGAIAWYLAESRAETRFLHVPPGAIRGIYYGEAENRIREIFNLARSAPGPVVAFFDELDSYGARGVGTGQDIDGRVLGAFLNEVDGLRPADNVLCIGASNRLDLIDPALMRPGRFGDRIHVVPRPGREATRHILTTTLSPELPYAIGEAEAAVTALVEAAVAYLHAPEGGAGIVATVTL
ncbi:MAG: AAA family ATPase, partial [Myxococcota bacterium]